MHAVIQTFLHLYYDEDQIDFPMPSASASKLGEVVAPKASPREQLVIMVPRLLQQALTRALVMCLVGPALYAMFLRPFAWNIAINWARILRNIPRTQQPVWYPPFHVTLMYRSALSGFLLVSLWKISNLVFNVYYVLPPTKLNHPLTDDSPDPAGSLLNGLKSRKQAVKVARALSRRLEWSANHGLAEFCVLGTRECCSTVRSSTETNLLWH